jgi:hypothetical protein
VGINNAAPGVALDVSGGANLVSTGGSTTNNALTTTGRVGINNASPGVALDVSGSVQVSNALVVGNGNFGSPTSTIPNGFYVRTGGSNWRDYIPLQVANSTINITIWGGPDGQWNDVNNGPANEIARQYSYFAGYWLNANRAVVGTTFSVESYASNGSQTTSRGTFTFRATAVSNDRVVTEYTGRLSAFSDPNTFYTLTPQQDGINAGVAISKGVVLNVTGTARISGELNMNSSKITNVTTPTVAADAANKAYVDGAIPIGGIIMWSGTIASIPTNWRLCNGLIHNGITTPDLRNRFIVCANQDTATYGDQGSNGVTVPHVNIEKNTSDQFLNTVKGGSSNAVVVSHSHGVTDPGHTHNQWNGQDNNYLDGTGGINARRASEGNYQGTIIRTNTTGITINTFGESGLNKNLPPYYALAFIMRIS